MFYISNLCKGGVYTITDTEDNASENYSIDEIHKFTDMGLVIKGVDTECIYPTLPVRYPCYTGEVRGKSDINTVCRVQNLDGVCRCFRLDGSSLVFTERAVVARDESGIVSTYDKVGGSRKEDHVYAVGEFLCDVRTSVGVVRMRHSAGGVLYGVSYRVDGVYFKAVMPTIGKSQSVSIRTVIASISRYQNAWIDGEYLLVDDLRNILAFQLSVLDHVYGTGITSDSVLSAARGKLLGKSEVSVCENGELHSAVERDGVLIIPEGVKSIRRATVCVTSNSVHIDAPSTLKRVEVYCIEQSKTLVHLNVSVRNAGIGVIRGFLRNNCLTHIVINPKDDTSFINLLLVLSSYSDNYLSSSVQLKKLFKGIDESACLTTSVVKGALDEVMRGTRLKHMDTDPIPIDIRNLSAYSGLGSGEIDVVMSRSSMQFSNILSYGVLLLCEADYKHYKALEKKFRLGCEARKAFVNAYLENSVNLNKAIAKKSMTTSLKVGYKSN